MRKHYIDNLRWLILLILIPYHAAEAWNTWGEPNYIFFEGNRVISSIIVFFSPYFMPLLFVLAGISTSYALQKRTKKEYLINRVKRLFVPLLFGTIGLMPVMTYLADKFHGYYHGGFVEHYGVFFTKLTDWTGADGGFSFGQFWFLLYLLVISVVCVGIVSPVKKIEVPFWAVFLLGLPLPLLSGLLSVGGKSFVEYTYLFLLGYYVFSDEKIIDKAKKNCLILFGIGLAATILNVYLFLWAGVELAVANTIAKYVSEWIMVIALIGLAKRYFDFSNKITVYMNRRSFSFYCWHFIWVVVFQYILYGIVGNRTVALFAGTVVLSYLTTFICCEIVLIGQSMGGYMAQSFLARYPEKVIGFVSIDSTPFGDYYSKSDIWWLKQIEWMCKPFSEKLLKTTMAKQNAVTKSGRENMLEMVSDYEKRELCHLMGIGYVGFLDDNRELQLSCPALILVGEKDNTGKVKQYSKAWSKRTGIKMTWIPNAAHNSNVDNPEFVNSCIGEFLENITIGDYKG